MADHFNLAKLERSFSFVLIKICVNWYPSTPLMDDVTVSALITIYFMVFYFTVIVWYY